MTSEMLLEMIKNEGVDKIVFNVPMKKLGATDGKVERVPCRVDIATHNPLKGLKIGMESMIPGYSNDSFYVLDFVELINKGIVEIRGVRFSETNKIS